MTRHTLPYLLALCLLSIVLLPACSDNSSEEWPTAAREEKARVTLTLSTRAPADTPANELEEYSIQTLRVYAFRGDKLEGYYYVAQRMDTTLTIPMVLPTNRIDFYLLANEETAGELQLNAAGPSVQGQLGPTTTPPANQPPTGKEYDLTQIHVTPAFLKALTFRTLPKVTPDIIVDEGERVYHSPALPLTAIHSVRINKNAQIPIPLERSVAKLELQFSKTGVGELYMGRGIYLYNEPPYGYLFARTAAELQSIPLPIGRQEDTYQSSFPTDKKQDPYYNNSFLHQLNGRILMKSGFPDEPENHHGKPDAQHAAKLDVNPITADYNDPLQGTYQRMPPRPIYLFANPYCISNTLSPAPYVSTQRPPTTNPRGYYLKILAHQHLMDENNQPTFRKEVFYVSLPSVEANEHITLYSVFTLSGFVSTPLRCSIKEWTPGGGDITFN